MKSSGEVVRRWTGYSTAAAFANSLRSSLTDLSSVAERLRRFRDSPTFQDALGLAKYYSDTGEHLAAVEFYRKADSLAKGPNVSFAFEIFRNAANASWKELIPFDDVLPTADAVLTVKRRNTSHISISQMSQMLARLARKSGRTGDIAKYLRAGIDATANSRDDKIIESHYVARADYALHIDHDTTEAIRIRKASLGEGWQENRDRFFSFAKWCLERKINLDEAEMFARKTVNLVYPGRIRAMVLNTAAEICQASGKTEEAVRLIRMAIDQEPENEFYPKQLERFQESLDSLQ
jgi:tetratricopeptide (TPR) repeat protein